MRSLGILGLLMLITVATTATAGCEEWIASFADYDAAFEEILEGEPERYLRSISNAIELRRGRDVSGVLELREMLAERATQLRALAPPPELAPQHHLLSDYLDSIVAAVAAVEERDLPYDLLATDELILRLPTRRCYETLLAYYRELLELFQRRQCNEGDVEALRDSYIPRLEEVLASRFTGQSGF